MKEKKGIKISIVLTLIGVVSLVTGITFAIYENTINAGKSQVIKTGIVNFTLTESTNGLVLDNLQELTDYEGMAQETFYEFTIKNTGNTITDYEISLVDKPNSSYTGTILDDQYVKAGLLKNNNKEIIVNLEETNRLIDKVTLDVDESVNYKLRLWLDFGDLEDAAKEALVGQKIFLALKINGIQNVNKIPTGADTLVKLTNNKDNSGLYTITHAADSTLQIGTNEDITEYRYRGASPKNYVTFNGETWRILGVFPTDDGNGNIENRIKLIRSQSIGTYAWDSSNKNVWSTSSLNKYFLGNYSLNLVNNNAYEMIGDAKYYLGSLNGPTTVNISRETMYQYERKISGSTYYYSTNPNSWVGKIALMYASDYGYAASDACTENLDNYNNTSCISNTWLYDSHLEWLLNPYAGNNVATCAISYSDSGAVFCRYSNNSSAYIKPVLYLKSDVMITGGDGTSSNPYTLSISKNEDTSGANAPVLASNMIPVYYDATAKVWKKADTSNKKIENRWYNYGEHIWANAVTVTSTNRTTYLNAKAGTEIPLTDINTMWVWIPRFNAVTPSNYNGGTQALPNAIDVTFVKPSETAIDAFTFGTKSLSGFWYAKFETSHSTLTSSTTGNNLACTTTTCTNANNILIKPSVKSLRYNNVSNFFFASRSMEQSGNSFGFVSSEVDTHMSKNNEWGAVAYLTQSIYGRCSNSTTCSEIGINNNSGYITGIGAAPGTSNTSSTTNTYDTTVGMGASTTGNIYGVYDMNGGAWEYVMGVYNKTISGSGFSSLPDEKYYNNYTATTYQGHVLTETARWYSDNASFVNSNLQWFRRGGYYSDGMNAGVFNFDDVNGGSSSYASSHFVITNE